MARPLFSIGLVADCQYADADSVRLEVPPGSGRVVMDRFYRQSLGKLQEAVGTFNRLGVDAIINLGDSVDRQIDEMGPVMEILHEAHAPVWNVAGNHDFADASPTTVFAALKMPSGYYEKSIGNFRFLFLDTNEIGTIQHPPGSPEFLQGSLVLEQLRAANRPNAHDWNGGVGGSQLEWVRNQLLSARLRNEKVVLLTHHPFYPMSTHNMLNDLEFCDVVGQFPEIVVAFSGHDHEGNFGVLGRLQCVTLRGMVEHEDNAFAIARVYADRIELEGFGREPSSVLQFG